MNTMEEYAIYCTAEQTKKALELCAPIGYASINDIRLGRYIEGINDNEAYRIPTAEQMIGFLRSKGIKFHFNDATKYWRFSYDSIIISYGWCEQKELAAIDAALEYIENLKQ